VAIEAAVDGSQQDQAGPDTSGSGSLAVPTRAGCVLEMLRSHDQTLANEDVDDDED
jgi:hypothetical protein